jgi:hypothetical protein
VESRAISLKKKEEEMKKIKKLQNENQHQHGDVMLEVSDVDLSKAKELKELILAEGETTGHAHRIKPVAGVKVYEENGIKYVVNSNKTEALLTHEEHKTIAIPKGKFRIGIVKEVDPFSEEIRNVRD